MARATAPSLFTAALVGPAMVDAVRKLAPQTLVRNPVMFVTGVVAALLTLLLLIGNTGVSNGLGIQIVVWLWLTVLFGNFAKRSPKGAARRRRRRYARPRAS